MVRPTAFFCMHFLIKPRMQSLDSNGKWPDVDYTTGCDARRASWPAQSHWSRLGMLLSKLLFMF